MYFDEVTITTQGGAQLLTFVSIQLESAPASRHSVLAAAFIARIIKPSRWWAGAVKRMSTKALVQAERVYPPAAQSEGSTSPGRSRF